MGKLIPLIANAIPLIKRFIFPNGKYDDKRALFVLLLILLVPIGIYFLGEDTMNASLHYINELVPLLGTLD